MEKKKILFLINTLNGGGAEKVLCDLVNHLNPDMYDITVQTVINSGIYQNQLKPHIRYKSIFPKWKLFSYLWSKFICGRINPKRFYQRYVKENYDIEVAFLEGFPTKILSASENSRKFAWVHTDLYHYYGHKNLFRTIEENRQAYLQFQKIVCVSQSAKDGFHRQFGEMDTAVVCHNPIDEKSILKKSMASADIVVSDEPTVIAVGRLVPQKGFDRLLRIHKKLLENGISHKLWIVGEGNERKNLEAYISEQHLEYSVRLWGYQKNPYPYLKAADLFVCSSYVEGFSTVLVEALICGVAAISTNCSGAGEILNDSEYGLLVDNQEEALHEGLKKLLSSKELLQHYREKATERGQMFCMESCMKEIEDIWLV